MNKKLKAALFALAAIGMLLVPFAQPGKAEAAPRVAVGGGSGIVIDGRSLCTMTTVGRDRSGNLVGLTAAHCGKVGSTIRSERRRNAGVIGRIVLRNTKLDAAVIALNPAVVQPVRQVGEARITAVGRFPSGGNVCKSGRTTGFTCGPVLAVDSNSSISYVCANHGDSGGPVIKGNRVVAMLNGGAVNIDLPCYNPAIPVFNPMFATKMTDIVASLNRYGRAGAGFRPI